MAEDQTQAQLNMLYAEAGVNWRHFAVWREKTIAGYILVVGAIATAFVHVQTAPMMIALMVGTIGVSLVFWALDFRTRLCLGVCQAASANLEREITRAAGAETPGCYSALMNLRFIRADSKLSAITHSGAVDCLVGGVLSLAVGLVVMAKSATPSLSPLPILSTAVSGLLFLALTWLAHKASLDWEHNLENLLVLPQAKTPQNADNVDWER